MHAAKGDKIRMRGAGRERGVVEEVVGGSLLIRLPGQRRPIRVPQHAVTNLSLAARKAWTSMPERNVGRPKGAKTVDRVSVTLRFDRDVWDRFIAEEQRGRIRARTEVVNSWFREKLAAMDEGER